MLIYLALLDVSVSEQSVAEHIYYGGHDNPPADIHRRFPRILANLFDHYGHVCDQVSCYDNTSDAPLLVFEQTVNARRIYEQSRIAHLQDEARR